jgi:hypothetical protein
MTAETRLASVANRLTPMERARICLRMDFAGEKLTDDLLRVLRPEEPDCARIIEAVRDANHNVHTGSAFTVEWLYQEEIQLGWLRCLDAMLARDAVLREAVTSAGWAVSEGERPIVDRRAKHVQLEALPQPGLGLTRTLPLVWGRRAFPDEDDVEPADLASLRDRLAFDARRAHELRWRDYLAEQAVLAELAEVMGEESMVHHEIAATLDAIEAKLLELYEALCQRGERFPLPERDEQRVAYYREGVRWDDLRDGPIATTPGARQQWVPPHMVEQLDALEARLADELRTPRKTTVDFVSERSE